MGQSNNEILRYVLNNVLNGISECDQYYDIIISSFYHALINRNEDINYFSDEIENESKNPSQDEIDIDCDIHADLLQNLAAYFGVTTVVGFNHYKHKLINIIICDFYLNAKASELEFKTKANYMDYIDSNEAETIYHQFYTNEIFATGIIKQALQFNAFNNTSTIRANMQILSEYNVLTKYRSLNEDYDEQITDVQKPTFTNELENYKQDIFSIIYEQIYSGMYGSGVSENDIIHKISDNILINIDKKKTKRLIGMMVNDFYLLYFNNPTYACSELTKDYLELIELLNDNDHLIEHIKTKSDVPFLNTLIIGFMGYNSNDFSLTDRLIMMEEAHIKGKDKLLTKFYPAHYLDRLIMIDANK